MEIGDKAHKKYFISSWICWKKCRCMGPSKKMLCGPHKTLNSSCNLINLLRTLTLPVERLPDFYDANFWQNEAQLFPSDLMLVTVILSYNCNIIVYRIWIFEYSNTPWNSTRDQENLVIRKWISQDLVFSGKLLSRIPTPCFLSLTPITVPFRKI